MNGDGYDDLIVGAPYYDHGETDEGQAFVYNGSANGLSTAANWTADSDQAFANFGVSVASAGDVNGDGYDDVIVGAVYHNDEGAAFVFDGSAAGLSPNPSWIGKPNYLYAYFGVSVASAGDVNGDGYDDVIVGASDYNRGKAFVYEGSPTGLSTLPSWTAEPNEGSQFGVSVGTAGDVNGDGYADVIVGDPLYSNGQSAEGKAYAYLGSETGLGTSPSWTAESDQAEAYFGGAVGTAGDVNGDGYADVIVGANHYDNGETDEGRAYVYEGSTTGLSTTANWTAEPNEPSVFGYAVGTAGDVNADGYADVIVGAPFYSNGQTWEGRAFVYTGSASGLGTSASWIAESNQELAYFGISVGPAGDVNGDGYSDLSVGAYQYDVRQTDEGVAFVYRASIGSVLR